MLDSKGCLVSPAARYSTLQDLDAGRHTEIDMFSGTLMRMGEECGIPTPFNTCIYHLIKAREEKNDGLFDYEGKTDKSCWAKQKDPITKQPAVKTAGRLYVCEAVKFLCVDII